MPDKNTKSGFIGKLLATIGTAGLIALPSAALAEAPAGQNALPKTPPPFDGKIGVSYATSTPGTPFEVKAPKGAPNVLLVMTDDVGFGASSTFGGLVPTPNLDELAQHGLRYNRFHVTAMCSPTRAALLTGRNHHAVGQGVVTEAGAEYPGYDIRFPRSAATIGRILHDNGYDTAFFGKHHNIHVERMSMTGPFDAWPTHLGFDYFYGFILGETDQYSPKLYEGTTPVDLSHKPADYILDKDLADKAIDWIDLQAAQNDHRPFFIYYATGSTHSPHQAPRDWIDKFRGKFDEGWDKTRQRIFDQQKKEGIIPANADISPRPAEIPAWDSLTAQQKRVYARFMEVYAGELAFQDAQVGRIIAELKRTGQFDNTLILFIEGDNGASMEGGPKGKVLDYGEALNGLVDSDDWAEEMLDKLGGPETSPLYPSGWAWAMNTPFPWAKRVASHLGGTRDGLVVSWPDKIKQAGMRSQYTHVTDVLPTILEATGIEAPDLVDGVPQQPINGVSFRYSFEAPQAPSRHNTQYYELMGNRGIYHDGWLANTTPDSPPWQTNKQPGDVLNYKWELYNLDKDFSQTHNLAAKYPERLKALQDLWLEEAKRNDVLPLDNRFFRNAKMPDARTDFVYWGAVSVPRASWPLIFARSFTLTAEVDVDKPQTTGVLASTGSITGGWSFYLKDGKPAVFESYSPGKGAQFRIVANDPIPPGPATIRYEFDYDGPGRYKGGTMRILVNGTKVAEGRIDRTINAPMPDGETFDIGSDLGAKVSPDYEGAAPFGGKINKLSVHVSEAR